MLRTRCCVLSGLCVALILSLAWSVVADDRQPDVVVFYRDGCNDCLQMDRVLDELVEMYPDLVVTHIEEQSPGAADLMWSMSAKVGIFPSKFPVIFAGDIGIVGSGRDKELLLRSTVRDCVFEGCDSPLGVIEGKPFPLLSVLLIAAGVLVIAVLLLP